MDLRGSAQSFRAGFGEAEGSELALGNKLGHGGDGFLDGNIGIDAMLIIEIDRFNAQALQARVARAANVLWRTIDTANSVGTDAETKFGGDDYGVARYLAQETAEQFFILVRAVDFRGVEKVAAEFQIAVKNLQGFLFVGGSIGHGH